MAGEMKISFGFSKVSKKPSLIIPHQVKEEVQYIDCLEDKSIKVIGGYENNEKAALIIPVKNESILRDKMVQICKARSDKNNSDSSKRNENEINVKALTLDELAAKEILEDLKNGDKDEEGVKVSEIPLNSGSVVEGEVESRLEDYDAVPVEQFGLAVLRGMGWDPSKGVGKTARTVKPIETVLRPKGMALGADAAFKKPPLPQSATKETLLMKVTAPIKVIAGPYKNLYGKVESFDDATGRIIVRLTLQNNVISINENMVQLVTMQEFSKNSKVMNLREYNEFKDKEEDVEGKSSNKPLHRVDKGERQSSRASSKDYKRKNIDNRYGNSSKSYSRRKSESSDSSPERSDNSKRKNTDRKDYKSLEKKFSRRRSESSSNQRAKKEKERKVR